MVMDYTFKCPHKAKVKFEHEISMSDGEKRILDGETIEVCSAPQKEDVWTCRFQGKEFTISKDFLEVTGYLTIHVTWNDRAIYLN